MSKRKGTDVVMPVVATLASAIASYLAKKGPQYLEQTLLPKVRETKAQATGEGQPGRDEVSTDDLERRRRERAEHRAARRKAS